MRTCHSSQLLLSLLLLLSPIPSASGGENENATLASENPHQPAGGLPPLKVWLSALLAILVISLVGLAGVAAVPLVHSTYYNHFIQYLVALAVGSLTGDAMLHLLPHAIVKSAMAAAHLQRWHSERQTVLKGLAALAGVYCFFVAEKLVVLAAEHRSERQALLEQQQAEPRSSLSDGRASLERQRRRVSRMYGEKSCDEIITTGLGSKALRSIDNFHNLLELSDLGGGGVGGGSGGRRDRTKSLRNELSEEAEPNAVAIAAAAAAAATAAVAEEGPVEAAAQQEQDKGDDNGRDGVAEDRASKEGGAAPAKAVNESTVAMLESRIGHGHGHSTHSKSLAPMACMVILGDGLHNFADGLAVGAAFAQSLAGGASTSLAVLCHELPHELGDFAVLLKTGMSPRRALLYNGVSSLLAALGAAIGVCVGSGAGASYWLFAVTGGIFVYIPLVDMLPELNLLHVRAGESRAAHFVLQNAGIATGVGIMCLIALFEDRIRHLLGDEDRH